VTGYRSDRAVATPNEPHPRIWQHSSKGRGILASAEGEEGIARVFREIAEAVAKSGIEVALIGGAAVNTFEDPRYTKDLDLTVEADRVKIGRLVESLLAAGFEVTREQDASEPSGPDFIQLRRRTTVDMVDLIVAKTEFQELVIRRALRAPGQVLPVATVEDLVILKLIANRPVDQRDAFLLARDNAIDWPYVERWAATWDVSDRLRALRAILEPNSG
jgi:hypothetical protein